MHVQMTPNEVREMKTGKKCPLCDQHMHSAEIEKLLSKGSSADDGADVEESYRGMCGIPSAIELPDGVRIDLSEAGRRVDFHAQSLAEDATIAAWGTLLGSREAGVAAARGRREPGGAMSPGALRSLQLHG